MNLSYYQTEMLINFFDRLFGESKESQTFSKNIPVDELEELWNFRDKMIDAVVAYESSMKKFDNNNDR